VDKPQASAAAASHRKVDYHRHGASSAAAQPRGGAGDGHYRRRNDYTPSDQDFNERTHVLAWVGSIGVGADEMVAKGLTGLTRTQASGGWWRW
jgi:hypothetical protein